MFGGNLDGGWKHFMNNLKPVDEDVSTESYTSKNRPKKVESLHKTSIQNLDQFTRCAFYRIYSLRKADGWKLQSGAYNHSYEIGRAPEVDLEIQTKDSRIIGVGFTFYGRSTLQQNNIIMIHELLQTLDSSSKLTPSITDYISSASNRRVSQINKAKPKIYGDFFIYAGKVGSVIVISIDRR